MRALSPDRRRLLLAGMAAGLGASPAFSFALQMRPAAISPFEPGRVKLLDGPLLAATEGNRRRLRAQDPDRLLHMFRVTAGLPSKAEPLGGWEAPVNELRGHFTGHFLSACALMWTHHGDAALKAKGQAMVAVLAQCQAANGGGYVSAFPASFYDRLKARDRVWAPFYTQHKLLAGLIDMATLAGDAQAKAVAEGLGDWVVRWLEPVDDAHLQDILNTEFGGMSAALFDLEALSGDPRYGMAARRFEKRKFLEPLAGGRDELTGLHANTHIPQVIGAARRFETTGEARYRAICETFWETVVTNRTFATGGTSSGEGWAKPLGHMADELDAYTCECCCSYNMMKLTRHLQGWRADPRFGDYQERLLFNAILGTQNPADGMMLYYVPMQTGWWKLFSGGDGGFWCCDGTGIESFAKLGDSLYFHEGSTLYVNQFAASELDWAERGVKIVQQTRIPDEAATRLTLHLEQPRALTLMLRIPAWAEGASAKVNGAAVAEPVAAGRYLKLERSWADGDVVELTMPMRLRLEGISGDPGLKAVMYGPLVLAGRLEPFPIRSIRSDRTKRALGSESGAFSDDEPASTSSENALGEGEIRHAPPTPPRQIPEFKGEPAKVAAFKANGRAEDWIKPVAGQRLTFQTVGQAQDVTFAPFNRFWGGRYGIYWRVTG